MSFLTFPCPPPVSIISHLLRNAFIFLALFLLDGPLVAAQGVQHTENKPDLAIRSDLKVDPATLGLSLEIPLGGVAGRAGNALPLSLRYSSKLWRIDHWLSRRAQNQSISYVWTRPEFGENSAVGWTSSFDPPYIELTGQKQLYNDDGTAVSDEFGDPVIPGAEWVCYIKRLNIHLPDGSSHELRKSEDEACFYTNNPQYDWTGRFYAVDGSNAFFDFADNTLYLPDGSRYLFTSGSLPARDGQSLHTRGQLRATTYLDRNGNRMDYTHSTTSPTWTDTAGRTYQDPLPAQIAVEDRVYYAPGVGGTQLPYTFKWRYLADVREDAGAALRPTGDRKCTGFPTLTQPGAALFTSDTLVSVCAKLDSGGERQLFNPILLGEIVLPTGQSYVLRYNSWGELTRVTLPTGGYERYEYAAVAPLSDIDLPHNAANRGVVKRWVSATGQAADEKLWQYQMTGNLAAGYNVSATTAPDGSATESYLYRTPSGSAHFGKETPLAGRIYDERSKNPSGQMLRRTLQQWVVTATPFNGNAHVTKTVNILLDTGGDALTTTTTMAYDADLNLIETKLYDYASVSAATAQTGTLAQMPQGALLRSDETTYLVNDTTFAQSLRDAYRARNFVKLLSSSRVRNAQGQIVAQSAVRYDETGYRLADYTTVTQWNDPQTEIRGNATTSRSWLNWPAETWLETHVAYDQCGQPRQSWDALGRTSSVSYADNFDDNQPRNSYAYATSATGPAPDVANGAQGSPNGFTVTTQYDFTTGRVTATTDARNQTTTTEYYGTTGLNRLRAVTGPDAGGSAGQSRSEFTYSDTPGSLWIKTRAKLTANASSNSDEGWAIGYEHFDGLGRSVRAAAYLGNGALATAQPWSLTETQYDDLGRVAAVSNPFAASTYYATSAGVNGLGWTQTVYDALGRVTQVQTPDGATVQSLYSGNQTTVTDAAGRQRRSVTDAAGRLTQVIEDPSGLNYLTTYLYDTLGNLRKVTQGDQQRYFAYDSLARLVRARNPEQNANTTMPAYTDAVTGWNQWSLAYTYDAAGNLTQRLDARGVAANYQYDRLNRNTVTSYSDGLTPTVTRFYDGYQNGYQNLAYSQGQLWRTETAGLARTTLSQFDPLGRPHSLTQTFWSATAQWNGAAYTIGRDYDTGGRLTQQSYPSGHTTTYSYTNGGALAGLSGNLGDGVTRSYLSAVKYNERGLTARETYGTLTPLYHKQQYNLRGQLWDMQLGTDSSFGPTTPDVTNAAWNRGRLINHYASNVQLGQSGNDNNGNLLRQEVYLPNAHFTQQNYTYDALNRLTSAAEKFNGTGSEQWRQQYDYDRYGNRTLNQTATTGYGVPKPNFAVDTPTNRLTVPNGAAGTMSYDAAGNLNYDNYTGGGTRIFDAENRMQQAWNGAPTNGYLQGQYGYDGDGRRIARTTGGVTTWQVYGLEGELVAEYAAQAHALLPQKEYGYQNGKMLISAVNGDETRLRRFVENFYQRTWLTLPDQATIQAQVNALAAQGLISHAAMLTHAQNFGASLFTSTTYLNRNTTNGMYVADLYLAYLQRPPDEGGFEYWKEVLDNNQISRATLRDAFAGYGYSPSEFGGILDALRASGVNDYDRVDRFVNYVYTATSANGQTGPTTAQRDAERTRFDVAEAQSREAVRDAAQALGRDLLGANANNYQEEWSDAEYVRRLYETFLRHAPDTAGWEYWAGEAGKQGRGPVLGAFLEAGAYREQADALYREIYWLVGDQLGTPRLIVSRTGSLASVKRHDYLPFGEELPVGAGGRATSQGYVGDSVRQQFTQYERDDETGLDYAQARYYGSNMGRFISVDPIYFQAKMINDPQAFNLYAYTRNSPTRFVDPSGEAIKLPDDPVEREKVLLAFRSMVGKRASNSLYVNWVDVKDENGKVTGKEAYLGIKNHDKFAKINDVAGELEPIVSDSKVVDVRIAQKGQRVTFDSGESLILDGHGAGPGTTPGTTGTINGRLTIHILDPSTSPGVIPAEYMWYRDKEGNYVKEAGRSGQINQGILLGHELGHARAEMTGDIGPDDSVTPPRNRSDNAALRIENKVRALRNPNGPFRASHWGN